MDKLLERRQKVEKLLYAPNEQTPYAGWVYEIGRRGNGQKDILLQLKDGKPDGLLAMFHENGQKYMEGRCKDGEKEGLWMYWEADGTESKRETFKDGISVRN